ncbi:hypothetical protein [Anaerobium acetethylicum]|uniref:Uncharacterized protein n=1 Tax=Anaerobium acetethylicum TaxID=1619234 RepID=A0A1D3TYM3_9FIRM|nr:hypothetical protein [Anaerobium acetethylicum]SCP99549.1 hypothetical protein SAMN05421730_10462 [Anaerobium acetethylicum]
MRIRLVNCNTTDVKNTLDDMLNEFNIELGIVNLYVNYTKDGESSDLYNVDSLESAYIKRDISRSYRHDDELVCLTRKDIDFIKYTMAEISDWPIHFNRLMRYYLVKKFGKLSNDTEKIKQFDFENAEESLEKILQDIINNRIELEKSSGSDEMVEENTDESS